MAQICKKWEKYNHESIYHNIAYNGERSEITKFRLSLIDNLLNKVWEYKKTDYFIPIKSVYIYLMAWKDVHALLWSEKSCYKIA